MNTSCKDSTEEESEVSSQAASNISSSAPVAETEAENTTDVISLNLSLDVKPEDAMAVRLPIAGESDVGKSPDLQRVFTCNYCQRKFYSSQALGGHQNAHRRERTLAKHAMRADTMPYGYANIASLPLYGSTMFPLGIVQAHSSAHHAASGKQGIPALLMPARGTLGPVPFIRNDEDAIVKWPGSSRHAGAPGARANLGDGGSMKVDKDLDLTLRL